MQDEEGCTALRIPRVFAAGLGDQNMVVEDVSIEIETRAGSGRRPRCWCSRCGRKRLRRAAVRGAGPAARATTVVTGMRRWRTLDVGSTKAYLQAPAPRVSCREHGVVVAHVPWARPGAKCGYVFEDTCAWLAAHTALSVVTVFLRLAWRTVADIVTRVVADGSGDERPAHGAGADRCRRDRLPQGASVLDRDRRPRDRPVGVGGRGPQPETLEPVLRRARRRIGQRCSRTCPPTAPNGSTPW